MNYLGCEFSNFYDKGLEGVDEYIMKGFRIMILGHFFFIIYLVRLILLV